MQVTTNLPIQDSYRDGSRQTNLIYHANIELIACGFHRGVLGASSAITSSHIGHQIPNGVTAAMARLDVSTDPGTSSEAANSLKAWTAELLFT